MRALTTMMNGTMENRFVGGLTELTFVKDQLYYKTMKVM